MKMKQEVSAFNTTITSDGLFLKGIKNTLMTITLCFASFGLMSCDSDNNSSSSGSSSTPDNPNSGGESSIVLQGKRISFQENVNNEITVSGAVLPSGRLSRINGESTSVFNFDYSMSFGENTYDLVNVNSVTFNNTSGSTELKDLVDQLSSAFTNILPAASPDDFDSVRYTFDGKDTLTVFNTIENNGVTVTGGGILGVFVDIGIEGSVSVRQGEAASVYKLTFTSPTTGTFVLEEEVYRDGPVNAQPSLSIVQRVASTGTFEILP